jgi:hypothetical protein
MNRREMLKYTLGLGVSPVLVGAMARSADAQEASGIGVSGLYGVATEGGAYEAKDLMSGTVVSSGTDAWTVIHSVISIPGAYVLGGNGTFNLRQPLLFDKDHVRFEASHGCVLQASAGLGFPASEPVVRGIGHGIKLLGPRVNAAGFAAGGIEIGTPAGPQLAINEVVGCYVQGGMTYGIRNTGPSNGAHILDNRVACSSLGTNTRTVELLANDGTVERNELSGYSEAGIYAAGANRLSHNHYFALTGSTASGLVIRSNAVFADHEYIDWHSNGPPVLIQSPGGTVEQIEIDHMWIFSSPSTDDTYSVFKIDASAGVVRDLKIVDCWGKTSDATKRWKYLLEIVSLPNLKSFTFENNKPFRNVFRTKNVSPLEWPTKNNRVWNGSIWVGF